MDKKLINFFTLILIIILLYIFWKAEIVQKEPKGKYVIYYIVTGLLIILLNLLRFFRKHIRQNFLIVFINIVVCIYIVEFSLHFYYGSDDIGKNRNDKLEFIEDYKKFKNDFKDGYPSWNGGYVKKDSVLGLKKDTYIFSGLANKDTMHCDEHNNKTIHYKKEHVYKSDRFGFNNPDFIYDENKIKIILIGDSAVHSQCVSEQNGFAGNLKKLYGTNNILSIAWRGAGPLEELGMLSEYAIKNKPEYILWVYAEINDYIEIFREQRNPILMNYLNDDFTQNLIYRNNHLNKVSKSIFDKKTSNFKLSWDEKNHFLSFIKHRIKLWKIRWTFFISHKYTPKITNFDLEMFEQILIKAKKRSESVNSKFIFVYLPEKQRYQKKNWDDKDLFKREEVLNLVSSLSIPIIDLHEIFRKQTNPTTFFELHQNEKGYKISSEYIFNKMKRYKKTF
tara:strand:+ start:1774 stop:3120 length:1347 start_codon:yes stop_codon:yes gene_type:complete